MFSPDMIKPAIYLAIITAVIGAATAGYNAIEQSGYDRAQSELLEKFQDDLAKVNAEHREQLATAVHEREFFKKQAIMLQNQDPVVLTKIKERIVYENINTCTRISGFAELWNARAAEFTF